MTKQKLGFTLIELLVVVIIIAVLAAIAVPQYQKAVLKSRFSTVMPIAKSLAQANEVYYLGNGYYAQSPAELDVESKDTTEEAYPEGTRVLMYDGDELSYVRATNDNVPNARYIVYQKNSKNFADTTMCEASDDPANALCVALGGEEVPGGNSSGESGWTAYLLTGGYGSTDQFAGNPGEDAAPQTPTCDESTKPADIVISETKGATATCVNGQWKYEWTGGTVYDTDYNNYTTVCETGMGTANAYACAGNEYKGKLNRCRANAEYGCAGATFSGQKSYCLGYATDGCAGATFSGKSSTCLGDTANGCAGSTFSGPQSLCHGKAANVCMGAIIQAGASCAPSVANGCTGALYGPDPTGTNQGMGSCFDGSGYCPTGVPLRGSWNETNGSFEISGWKGNCCNPAYMVSGACPDGISICS